MKTVSVQLTEEQKNLALELAVKGETLTKICEELFITPKMLSNFIEIDSHFRSQFHAARQIGCDVLAESILDIADTYDDVNRARLKSESIRWLVSKRRPQVYGDRLDISVTEKVDISAALQEAKARTVNPSFPEKRVDALEPVIIKSLDKFMKNSTNEEN